MSHLFASRALKKFQNGHIISEYLFIVVLIVFALLGMIGFMGDTVSSQMEGMAQELAGQKRKTPKEFTNKTEGDYKSKYVSQYNVLLGVNKDKP